MARERFKAADANKDGKIDASELDAETGTDLKAMIAPTN
ncbi:EF-hand domain-containing protein [Terrabacter sp. 2RAF25]